MEAPKKLLFMVINAHLLFYCGGFVTAQLTIKAQTPTSTSDYSTPNTFFGTAGETIASSILDDGTSIMFWGIVPADSVNQACQQMVDTGSYDLTAHVTSNWGGGPDDLDMHVTHTGGCLATSDGSGTEIVAVDQTNRQSAIVCPSSDAGRDGCAVYITGSDVDSIHQGQRRRLLSLRGERRLTGAGSCAAGVVVGSVVGTGLGLVGCFAIWTALPFLPPTWCVSGVILGGVAIGTVAGCGGGGCFPGDALVQLPRGLFVPVSKLEIGDKVGVWNKDSGSIVYDDVYAFGHKDGSAYATFFQITMEKVHALSESSAGQFKTLELTALHFVPTSPTIGGRTVHKRAKDIKVGDYLWAFESNSTNAGTEDTVVPYLVTDISLVFKRGLFNPFTMSGTIVVGGVVASVHSEWFLDSLFEKFGVTSDLPTAYQLVLTLPRALYRLWGKEFYLTMYNWSDKQLNVVEFGTNYGGPILGTTVSAGLVVFVALASIQRKPKVTRI